MNTALQAVTGEVIDSANRVMPTNGQQNIDSEVTNNYFGSNPYNNCIGRQRTSAEYPALIDAIRYNLIVADDEITTHTVAVKNECVEDDVRKKYPLLTFEDREAIADLPALILCKNKTNMKASSDTFALVAKIKKVETITDAVKFTFEALFKVSQWGLNQRATFFAFNQKDYCNELDRSHWTIKDINLCNALKSAKL